MTSITLEERVALLEREDLSLKRQLPTSGANPWWEQIHGVFVDKPAFEEAMELGRRYRESQRPEAPSEDGDVSP